MKLLLLFTSCLLCIAQDSKNRYPIHKEAPKDENFGGGSSGVYDYLRFVNEMNLGLSVYKRTALPLKLPIKMRRNKFE